MQIGVTRILVTGPEIAATFWSHGILCCLQNKPGKCTWTACIRLPDSSSDVALMPWQFIASAWAAMTMPQPFYSGAEWDPDCAVVDLWLLAHVRNPLVQLVRRARIGVPERYWFVREPPKRGIKRYKQSVQFMESLCCWLCESLRRNSR